MSVPGSSRARWPGAAALSCAVLVSGCGSTVAGHPVAGEATTVQAHVVSGLDGLLPGDDQFPARYSVVRLPPEAAAQAAGDLIGITRGATVYPPGCRPLEQSFGPDQTAVAVGTDDGTRATVTVELTRSRLPLPVLRDQLERCTEIRVNQAGALTTVATRLDPAPGLPGDAIALRRNVIPDLGGVGRNRSMRTLLGQVGDVRITVTYLTFGVFEPDIAALDQLYGTTVRQVQNG
ncbi:sensor domain-containing protein [Nocardia sp. NPDC048505]|uniref:sensor domain-containing protein n=1 Tax=unclassified Nocardia TaxID=2637762 RepID=UPI0033F532D1